jgi:hypothetical protein
MSVTERPYISSFLVLPDETGSYHLVRAERIARCDSSYHPMSACLRYPVDYVTLSSPVIVILMSSAHVTGGCYVILTLFPQAKLVGPDLSVMFALTSVICGVSLCSITTSRHQDHIVCTTEVD